MLPQAARVEFSKMILPVHTGLLMEGLGTCIVHISTDMKAWLRRLTPHQPRHEPPTSVESNLQRGLGMRRLLRAVSCTTLLATAKTTSKGFTCLEKHYLENIFVR